MNLDELQALADRFVDGSPRNRVPADKAFFPALAGMRLYDRPLLGVCAADEAYLAQWTGSWPVPGLSFAPPESWLPGARSVLSLFLPFTGRVRRSNAARMDRPSDEWLHARIEGQSFVFALCEHLRQALEAAGFAAAVPSMDERFRAVSGGDDPAGYGSNWSERHVAHACGLGTFSLSRGLITRLGVAGRLGSVVTQLALDPTPGDYREYDAYCTRCGACAANCPAGAISVETGKDHAACNRFLEAVRAERAPYYGCGKCQVCVPCEHRIPGVGGRSGR